MLAPSSLDDGITGFVERHSGNRSGGPDSAATLVPLRRIQLGIEPSQFDRLQVLANASVIVADDEADTTEVASFEILAVPTTRSTLRRNRPAQTYWVAVNRQGQLQRHLLDLALSAEGLLVANSHIWYASPGAPLDLFIRFELHNGTYTIKVNGVRAVDAKPVQNGCDIPVGTDSEPACRLGPLCLTLVADVAGNRVNLPSVPGDPHNGDLPSLHA